MFLIVLDYGGRYVLRHFPCHLPLPLPRERIEMVVSPPNRSANGTDELLRSCGGVTSPRRLTGMSRAISSWLRSPRPSMTLRP